MLGALVPLLIRMALIHVVLLYGTNNVDISKGGFSPIVLEQRSVGAKLVLASRIFYAMFIWMSKFTVSEFLKRITIRIWRRSYELTLQGIRIFLVATFCAVVVATLAECRPFSHYWQVEPDPGPRCRSGFPQLITMGACDITTDVLLVVFPIPIVMRSGQSWQRKVQLTSLFSLSLVMIAVTATRVPEVIFHRGRQQYRTVWASSEILASTIVSNAIIIGSFLRDKGTKKNKFRSASVSDSIDRASVRRPTLVALQRCGSDDDLFRSVGMRVPSHLQEKDEDIARPAPMAEQASRKPSRSTPLELIEDDGIVVESGSSGSEESTLKSPVVDSPLRPSATREMSFFDVGGLLEDGHPPSPFASRSRATTLVELGAPSTVAQDFAPATPVNSRRGSQAFLQDIGGLGIMAAARTPRRHSDVHAHSPPLSRRRIAPPTGVLGPMLERHETQQSLQDAGGLLGTSSSPRQTSMASLHDSAAEDWYTRRAYPAESEARAMINFLSGGPEHDAVADTMRARAIERDTSTPEDMSLQDAGGLLDRGG